MAASMVSKGPLPILTSPFRRARETAAPLAESWKVSPQPEPRVGELPLPPGSPARGHAEWIKYARTRRWSELHESLHCWREQVVQALLEIETDTVVVTHFVAINAAVGHALHDDRVTCFEPENCSCTVLDTDGKQLRIVELGREGRTPAA